MSIIGQLSIHRAAEMAGLPREMADEILGFAFYDTVTAVYRAVQKANMAQVVDKFSNAYISRANHTGIMHEHWALCLSTIDDDILEVQFQAINCHVCGNYKASNTFIDILIDWQIATEQDRIETIPIHIRCACHL